MVDIEITNRAEFMSALKLHMLEIDIEQVQAAYDFSKYGHRPQVRDNGGRYFDHPRSVAIIVFQELKIYYWELIVTALLHDIVEDSFVLSEKRIALNFGRDVALWVKYLTKEEGVDYHSRLRECQIWQVLALKLCDRLHNLREIDNCIPEKQLRKLAETREAYIPLAEKLIGMLPEDMKHTGEYLKEKITDICDSHTVQ